ncbi:hypothetical protein SRHO_G00123790 [Serrasalmus rhombeus]
MLRKSFSQHGIPEMLVTDNGTCFTSSDFAEFMTRNGVHHVTTALYHTSSNGLAERAVQTFKELLKKTTEGSIETRVSRALFSYRITPQGTTEGQEKADVAETTQSATSTETAAQACSSQHPVRRLDRDRNPPAYLKDFVRLVMSSPATG